jgi:hypothetical protein
MSLDAYAEFSADNTDEVTAAPSVSPQGGLRHEDTPAEALIRLRREADAQSA